MPGGRDQILKMLIHAFEKKVIDDEISSLADVLENLSVFDFFTGALKLPEKTIELLRNGLFSGNNESRMRAAVMAERLIQETDFDIDTLKEGLAGRDGNIRKCAAWILDRLSDRRPVDGAAEQLAAVLGDENEKLRKHARMALANCHDKEKLVEILAEKLRGFSAIRTLSREQGRERLEIVKVFHDIAKKGADIGPAIMDIHEGIWDLNSSNMRFHTTMALKYALLNGDDRARAGIVIMMKDELWGEAAAIALCDAALGGDEKSLDALIINIGSSDRTTRNSACRGMEEFGKRGGRIELEKIRQSLEKAVAVWGESKARAAGNYIKIVAAIRKERMDIMSQGTVKAREKKGFFRMRGKMRHC